MEDIIVSFKDVVIEYQMRLYNLQAIRHISMDIRRGKITSLVGESGSGKTTLATAVLNCITEPGVISSGKVEFYSRDGNKYEVEQMTKEEVRKFRWAKVSMVFQGAQSSLNPVMTIYAQFKETMAAHNKNVTKDDVLKKAKEVLSLVNLSPERILGMYPHELSGGMKQRVMIAFALLLDPEMILLDEPTTALDVITQEYIFSLLKKINKEKGISMMLMTHDMGIVAKYSDYLGVLYGGRLMEYGTTAEVFKKRLHPYTAGLIQATPSLLLPVSSIKPIEGNPPNLLALPPGCPFAPRCPLARSECNQKEFPLVEKEKDHFVSCPYGDERK
ncbi:MAG: ABC transporter ATP-binding protein [Bacilli bacterium]|jgi:peptide/nickel transport system ATP-binding protein|nr:ABC transporter ATP-binding protein [Bacilli bacterium]